MDLLIVRVKGRFAHFRKFYTNSSSLSYSIPPRTTIAGLLAAIMGYERDSYYDIFSRENLNVAVKKENGIRKIMQTLNYIKATSPKNILEPSDHTQIPAEIITGDDGVCYKIYINHKDRNIMDELEYRIKNNKYVFAPYFGAAPFNCVFSYIERTDGEVVKCNEEIYISTPIKSDCITEGSIDIFENDLKLLKERMPGEFLKNRTIGEASSYIYDENGHPLKLRVNGNYVKLQNENIIFM